MKSLTPIVYLLIITFLSVLLYYAFKGDELNQCAKYYRLQSLINSKYMLKQINKCQKLGIPLK